MTNQKKEPNDKKNGGDDWEFSAVGPITKEEETPEVAASGLKKTKILGPKKSQLSLDEAALPRTKTRSAMAKEVYEKSAALLDEDVYNYAPIPKRAIAFILDVLFVGCMFYAIYLASPLLRKLIQLFLDHYKLQFIVPETFVMKSIIGVSALVAVFFFIVIPVAFFNVSFGKKILGLRVRGTERYTIPIGQAFKRELILKPISVVIVAGFVTPFFSKKRQSIHDMLANTIVIEE